MIKSLVKVFFANTIIVLVFIFFIELFFGHWFDKNNLGPYMREHRMKNQMMEYELNGVKETYFYRRNYYGFRGKDILPSDIQAIFLGPSTIDQRYEPEKFTITGFLNSNLNNDSIDLEIINAGVEAQSTRGMILSFKYWLFKLKSFSPKFILMYVGLSDHAIDENEDISLSITNGHLLNPSSSEQFFDNIKSRSIILDTIRIFKFKFLPKDKFVKYDGKIDENLKKNFNYKNYETAKKEFDVLDLKVKHEIKIKNFLKRIDRLYKLSKKVNSTPIFITNISSNGNNERSFALNISLMEHCKKKNYHCIDVARKLQPKLEYWKDKIHTSNIGSKAIADIIYADLIKILEVNK